MILFTRKDHLDMFDGQNFFFKGIHCDPAPGPSPAYVRTYLIELFRPKIPIFLCVALKV